MNFNEINPGIVKLVAMLQAEGFVTTDSGDGITNVELGMDDALDFPHVFMVVDADQMIAESHRLWALLEPAANFNPRVDAPPDQPLGVIEASYSPINEIAVLSLYNLDDAFLFGPDKDLDKKRLGYMIRFCDAWLEGPSSPREYASADERETERGFYLGMRESFAKRLADLNFDLPPF